MLGTRIIQAPFFPRLCRHHIWKLPHKEEEICYKCNQIAMEQSQDLYETAMRESKEGTKDGVTLTKSGEVRKVHNTRYAYGSGSKSTKGPFTYDFRNFFWTPPSLLILQLRFSHKSVQRSCCLFYNRF